MSAAPTDDVASALPRGGSGANSCTAGGATCGEPDGTSAFHPGCQISCPDGQTPVCLDVECLPRGGALDAVCKCTSGGGSGATPGRTQPGRPPVRYPGTGAATGTGTPPAHSPSGGARGDAGASTRHP